MRWAKQQIKLIECSIIMFALWVMVRLRVGMRDDMLWNQGMVVMMSDGEPPSWMSPYGG